MNDTCHAFTKTANENANHFLTSNEEAIFWPDAASVFDKTVSSIISVNTCKSKVSSHRSQQSSHVSLQKQQAAAEVAATQEVIKIMNTQHQYDQELLRLEMDDQKLQAEREALEKEIEAEKARNRVRFVSESAALRMKLVEKRKEVKRLEEIKKHNAAQARLQVYSEGDHSVKDQLSASFSLKGQNLYSPNPKPQVSLNPTLALNPLSPPFFSQQVTSTQVPVSHQDNNMQSLYSQETPITQVPTTLSVTFNNSHDASNDLVRTLAEAITANRIPIPESAICTGDPLKYNDWKLSFLTLIDHKNLPTQEKLFFLRKYVDGPAKGAIEGHFLVGTEAAYHAAWNTLEDRFGNPFIIGKSYCDKIHSWQKIGTRDSEEIRKFVDFLTSVESAMPYVQGLQALNDCVENQRIAAKLPDWLSARWNRKATLFQDEQKMFPNFKIFVEFLNQEARIACNPITSLQAIKPTDQDRVKLAERVTTKSHRIRNILQTLTTTSSEKTIPVCMFCKRQGHTLHTCRKVMEKPIEEKVKFVQQEKLCFGCLETSHNSKACTSRSVRTSCGKPHPTCLHQNRDKKDHKKRMKPKQELTNESRRIKENRPIETATSNRVIQEKHSTHTSSIVPVYVSTTAEPDKEVLVYALLDSQSDTTFLLEEAAEALNVKKEPVKLKVSTITSKTKIVPSLKMNSLQVRGIKSDTKIKLPTTYTRDYIPSNRSHIPTSKTAESWPHLRHLADEMSPELDCEVGLLRGYNCPQAFLSQRHNKR